MMERLKPHGVEGSASNGYVLTSIDGEARWVAAPGADAGGGGVTLLDELDDVDTSTVAPDQGQALMWNGLRWVPGDVATGEIGDPQVFAASTSYAATGPYSVDLPVGVDETFPGKFVVVLRWSAGPGTTSDGVAGIDPSWTQAGWDGAAGQATTVVLVREPVAEVEFTAGTGPCSIILLAVAEVGELRGHPGERLTVNDGSSLTGWSAPSAGTTVEVTALSGDQVVKTSAASDPYLVAVARLDQLIDFTGHPTLEVAWQHNDAGPIDFTVSAVIGGSVVPLTKTYESGTGAGPQTSRFLAPQDHATALIFTAGEYGNIGPGYDLFIRDVDQIAPDYGTTTTGAGTTVEVAPGLPVANRDLVIVAGAAKTTGAVLTATETGLAFELEASRTADVDLTIAAWTALADAATVTPTVTSGAAATDLSAVVIAFGPSLGNGNGSVGGGLPEGGADGDVLTWQDGVAVWQPPALPPASTYLVPLTTVVAGEPMLVWTEDNQLVFVEETL